MEYEVHFVIMHWNVRDKYELKSNVTASNRRLNWIFNNSNSNSNIYTQKTWTSVILHLKRSSFWCNFISIFDNTIQTNSIS